MKNFFKRLLLEQLVCRAYSFQTYAVLEVLTASKMNQGEVNIRDHVHGTAGVVALTGAQGAGLVMIESKTASASATLDFTTGINSTYDEYLVTFTAMLPATNGTYFMARFSDDGGATFKAGASDYTYDSLYILSDATTVASGGTTTKLYLSNTIGNTTADGGLSGEFRLFNPSSSTMKKLLTWLTNSFNTLLGVTIGGGRFIASNNAVNGIRFFMDSGNITSGTVTLYGVRKA